MYQPHEPTQNFTISDCFGNKQVISKKLAKRSKLFEGMIVSGFETVTIESQYRIHILISCLERYNIIGALYNNNLSLDYVILSYCINFEIEIDAIVSHVKDLLLKSIRLERINKNFTSLVRYLPKEYLADILENIIFPTIDTLILCKNSNALQIINSIIFKESCFDSYIIGLGLFEDQNQYRNYFFLN